MHYTLLKAHKIKKADFREFLENSEEYKWLKEIRDFDVNAMLVDLETTGLKTVEHLLLISDPDLDLSSMSPKDIVSKFLRMIHLDIMTIKRDQMFPNITNIEEFIKNQPKENRDFLRKIVATFLFPFSVNFSFFLYL